LLAFTTSCEPTDRTAKSNTKEAKPPPGRREDERPEWRRLGRPLLEAPNNPAGEEVARRLAQRQGPTPFDASLEPAEMIAEFADASMERREEILALLGASGAAEAWNFLRKQAVATEQSIRLAALDALAVHDGGDASSIIARCLDFPDEETRALAVTLLGRRVSDPAVWARAATDASAVVRINYLAAVEEAPTSIRVAAARAALAAGHPQLRAEAASVLGGVRTKEAVELLIPLLDDTTAGAIASDGIFYFFGLNFESAAKARAWWSREAVAYADDLQVSDD